MAQEYRIEKDSMGNVRVPEGSYYGAQTERAVQNFQISGLRFPRAFIRALGLIKKAAAETNRDLGILPGNLADAIIQAAEEVAGGRLDGEFVLDVFQTGSGTSTNMNANEVIANRAIEILGGRRGSKQVHPNDHVNLGQSSNDVTPTAIHLSALEEIEKRLLPAARSLEAGLAAKAGEFDDVVKIGRTHLQDAVPIRLGQEFSGYASQVAHSVQRIEGTRPHLAELAIGGTAVGTGLNCPQGFAEGVIRRLADWTGLPFVAAPNRFEALAARDAAVAASGALRTFAGSLMKIANDLRWLSSGPRCGIGEVLLPATQPGSSIMPGKVNPVIPEAVTMVAAQVMGNDATIVVAGQSGNFELNVMQPVIAYNLLQSIGLLANASRALQEKCIAGIQADKERCEQMIERSSAMITALVPKIGYDRAAAIAKEAYETGRTIREIVREKRLLEDEELNRVLSADRMTR